MPNLILGNTTVMTESAGTATLSSNVVFGPSRHIVKIEQTVKNNRFVAAANTNEQLIPDFNCSITPSFANSKILVQYSFDTSSGSTLTAYTYIERKIGTGAYAKLSGMMGEGTAGNNNSPALSHGGTYTNWMMYKHAGMYQDTPSYTLGEAITYRIGVRSESTSLTIHVGSTARDNSFYHPRTASILILMEVAA